MATAVKPVLVYLLWAPLGRTHVENFVAAVRRHDAGIDHELIVAACGESDDHPLAPLIACFAGIEHSVEQFDGPRIDLQTYRELIDRRPEVEEFAFANSYARPLADGWLGFMIDALRVPGVGIVGAGGTYESRVATTPYRLGFVLLPRYARFPNPHIRTSAFAISRSAVEAIDWFDVRSKSDAWRLESGRKSLSNQLLQRGLRSVVVGRDGRAYEPDRWRESATFRAGDQRNLLVSDLRSDDYEKAGPEQRAIFETWAWGSPERSASD